MKNWTEDAMRAKGLKFQVTGGAAAPAVAAPVEKRTNKFGAQKTEVNGITFDSAAEAERYQTLKLLEAAREIKALGLQPSFALMGANGRAVAAYRADFIYFEGGRRVVEDVKSVATLTPASKLKLKLFIAQYPDHELRLVDGKGKLVPYKPRFPQVAA